jgi:hypothetical protein
MKRITTLGLTACLGLILATSAPTGAQTPPPASPAGAWQFATEKMGAGCSLSGNINFVRKADKSYTCKFNAIWACEQRAPRAVHTEQSCVATQTGENVIITSKMEKVSKVDPASMATLMQEQYAADHFSVKINRLGDRMDGLFRSYGQAPVVFRRQAELVS